MIAMKETRRKVEASCTRTRYIEEKESMDYDGQRRGVLLSLAERSFALEEESLNKEALRERKSYTIWGYKEKEWG